RLEVEHTRAIADRGDELEPRLADSVPQRVKGAVEQQGGRTGVRAAEGRNSVMFAVLPISSPAAGVKTIAEVVQQLPAARRVSVIVSSGEENGIRTFLERPEDPEHLRRSLEHAGVSADGRRAILVVSRNTGTLGSTLNTLSGFGYRPVCIRSARNVLEHAAHV